jgi:nicotinamide riboside kinase
MIVTFAGAGGTGKSTLAKRLSYMIGIPFFEAPTRNIPPEQRKTIRGQILVCEEYLKCYEKWHKEYQNNFICTRSLFDPIIYSKMVGWGDELIKEYVYYYLKQPYFPDVFIYTPIEFDMEEDGERELFLSERHIVDTCIKNLLDLYAPRYITVTGTVGQRLEQIYTQVPSLGTRQS